MTGGVNRCVLPACILHFDMAVYMFLGLAHVRKKRIRGWGSGNNACYAKEKNSEIIMRVFLFCG